jgi:16S rRNA (cytosine967-C5)-methyltransferase
MDTGTVSRREAIFILSCWLETNDFPDRLITDSPDRGFVMDLVYGAVRQRRALEWGLGKLVTKMPKGETRAALLAGAYQILCMPAVPAYAAVNATVEAAKVAAPKSAGFVNAVLRNLLRQRDVLLADLQKETLAVRLSHPDELVGRWLARYGEADTAALCAWNNQPADTVIALLPTGPSLAAYTQALTEAGVTATRPHPAAPDTCLILPHGVRVESLPAYAQGGFIIQDPSARMAVDLLDVQPGQRILDACAAPGGKTLQIAARLGQTGRLVAMDLHADRLPPLRANLARAGFGWVEVATGDAAAPRPPSDDWLFDRILLDVPCSNTGVLRRRPDARWRFTERRLAALVRTQGAIVRNALAWLAPGGRLVYSTCSLEPEENAGQIAALCQDDPARRVLATADRLPMRDATDGAFAAALAP